jgi:hypothetical protein
MAQGLQTLGMMIFSSLRFVLPMAVALVASATHATPPDCEAIAAQVGQEVGLPDGILAAIARVESNRGGRAWPWTLNEGGKGSYHPDKDTALAHLHGVLQSGTRNVDLGCMQLNWHWHSAAFPNAEAMLDPQQNIRYAALFLQELRARLETWEAAVAAYHSANPDLGPAYAQKVAAVWRDMQQAPDDPTARQDSPAPVTGLLQMAARGLGSAAAGSDLRDLRGVSLLGTRP